VPLLSTCVVACRKSERPVYTINLDLCSVPASQLVHILREFLKHLQYARGQCYSPFEQLCNLVEVRSRKPFYSVLRVPAALLAHLLTQVIISAECGSTAAISQTQKGAVSCEACSQGAW
jgi:hypothetical protein